MLVILDESEVRLQTIFLFEIWVALEEILPQFTMENEYDEMKLSGKDS